MYCFGKKTNPKPFRLEESPQRITSGKIASLQVVPSEFWLSAGKQIKFRVFGLDSKGQRVKQLGDGLSWEKWIPPTAKVQAELDGNLSAVGAGILTTSADAKLSAGALKVSYDDLSAVTRGRIIPALPYHEDFENGYSLDQQASDGIAFFLSPIALARCQNAMADTKPKRRFSGRKYAGSGSFSTGHEFCGVLERARLCR